MLTGRQGSCFLELARRPGDFAMVDVAAIVDARRRRPVHGARARAGGGRDQARSTLSDAARRSSSAAARRAATDRVGRAVADDVEIGPTHPRRRASTGARWSRCWPGARCAAPRGRPPAGTRTQRAQAVSRHRSRSRVNGRPTEAWVDPNLSLLELLRDEAARHRGQARLRRGRVRHLHGAARRRAGERVPDVRGAGRRRQVDHRRGLARRRRAAPAPAGASSTTRGSQCGFCTPGMIVDREVVPGPPSAGRPRGDPPGAVGQPVPLHRLHEDRRRGRGLPRRARGGDAGGD